MSGSACNAYQIRKIYAIGGALGMVKRGEDDDLLHELVNGMTGKTSIKELTYGEACKVIGELEGRQGTPPPRKSGRPLHKSVPGRTSEGQRRKIWALMYQLQAASPSKAQIGDRLSMLLVLLNWRMMQHNGNAMPIMLPVLPSNLMLLNLKGQCSLIHRCFDASPIFKGT